MFYNNDNSTNRESPRFALPYIVAVLQYICVASAIWILIEGFKSKNEENFLILWVIVPAYAGFLLAPLNLVTSAYYFWRYRDDPPARKWIVGISIPLSLLIISSLRGFSS